MADPGVAAVNDAPFDGSSFTRGQPEERTGNHDTCPDVRTGGHRRRVSPLIRFHLLVAIASFENPSQRGANDACGFYAHKHGEFVPCGRSQSGSRPWLRGLWSPPRKGRETPGRRSSL